MKASILLLVMMFFCPLSFSAENYTDNQQTTIANADFQDETSDLTEPILYVVEVYDRTREGAPCGHRRGCRWVKDPWQRNTYFCRDAAGRSCPF